LDYQDLKIGVLALQGAFREHILAIKRLGADALEVRLPGILDELDGLILPGGETTAIDKLIGKYEFREKLEEYNAKGRPIFGTCAGMIILSNKIRENAYGLGFIDISVKRNAYGRQIESFESDVSIELDGIDKDDFHAVFIRAPRIFNVGKKVQVLSSLGDEAILVRQDNILAGSFHPELTDDLRIHKYFLDMVISYKKEGEPRCQVIQNGIQ